MLNRLGVPYRIDRPWLEWEKLLVRQQYEERGPTYLADVLNRSVKSVAGMARRLGLQRPWRERYEKTG